MARTALETGNADSAAAWLNQYRDKKKSLHTNTLDDGENELYLGDLDIYLKATGICTQAPAEFTGYFFRKFFK